jgi:hypothetical protein
MSLTIIGTRDSIPERPFTDLTHTAHDLQVMQFMVTCLFLSMEKGQDSSGVLNQPWMFHHPTPGQWIYRIVITQFKKLVTHNPLMVVGFFGFQNANANISLAQSLDRGLISELSQFDSILAYVSVRLPTGNFSNLVVFTSKEGKEEWGKSEKHKEAIRLLTPDYYSAVRLYNGELPCGIMNPESMRLKIVKYFDYKDQPTWRAVRPLDA